MKVLLSTNSKSPRGLLSGLLSGLLVPVSGSLIFTACGGTSTNPLEGYKDVRAKARPVNELPAKAVPTPLPAATPEPVDNPIPETGALPGLFPMPNTHGEVLNFVDGQERTYALDIPVMLTGATLTIIGQDLPDGATLTRVAGNKYEFKWTPRNFVPQDRKFASGTFNITLNATKFADAKSLEAYTRAVRSHKMTYNVVPAQSKVPLIQNIKLASETISEGDNLAITVTVLDRSGTPQLKVLESATTSILKAARFVRFRSEPESLGSGQFRFSGKLSAAQMAVPGEFVVAAFSLEAVSPAASESSPISDIAVKVLRKKIGSKK